MLVPPVPVYRLVLLDFPALPHPGAPSSTSRSTDSQTYKRIRNLEYPVLLRFLSGAAIRCSSLIHKGEANKPGLGGHREALERVHLSGASRRILDLLASGCEARRA